MQILMAESKELLVEKRDGSKGSYNAGKTMVMQGLK